MFLIEKSSRVVFFVCRERLIPISSEVYSWLICIYTVVVLAQQTESEVEYRHFVYQKQLTTANIAMWKWFVGHADAVFVAVYVTKVTDGTNSDCAAQTQCFTDFGGVQTVNLSQRVHSRSSTRPETSRCIDGRASAQPSPSCVHSFGPSAYKRWFDHGISTSARKKTDFLGTDNKLRRLLAPHERWRWHNLYVNCGSHLVKKQKKQKKTQYDSLLK